MNKIAFITGASAGIGKSTAIMLAKNSYNIIISGRRKNLLDDLKKQIESDYQVEVITLNIDVRNRSEVEKSINSLPENWKNIDVLINNAGLAAGMSPIQSGDIEDWEKMIDTNVKGLLYVSRAIMPIMVERKTGHIVNISSAAGKETYANGNIYCATKHAVESLTKAMRIDMLPHGIKVSSVSPGMVETEFSLVRFNGDEKRAADIYKGIDALSADDIADTIEFIINRPKHVNINDIFIMPTAQATTTYAVRNT
jgi:NADP-dependent 3-hydroxy acid dehydrogenase YdfG